MKLLSAKTPFGDLAANGAVMLLKVRWQGEFDKTDRANPKFQAGLSYMATIQIHFVFEKGYVANHKIVNENYYMDSSLFKVTVNGIAAETENGSPGNPIMKVNLAIPAPELSEEEKATASGRKEKFDLRHAALRSNADAYTTAQANALWVDKQDYSSYRYTDYVSKLSNYTDRGLLRSWAVEPMAFMNALDLIKGNTATTLNPNGTCTIQQAVAVTSRSVFAHQIGWYQATENVRYQYGADGLESYITMAKGERVWVTGGRMGSGVDDTSLDNAKGGYRSGSTNLPVVEPRTGETCYISAAKLKPIRD